MMEGFVPKRFEHEGPGDCNVPHYIEFPRIYDPRGSLSFVEGMRHVPFHIARVYWIYDVPGGEDRGSHSHKRLQQVLVATSGSFDVEVTDGFSTKVFRLNKPYEGLYIPPGVWRTLVGFSSGSVCLSMVSEPYEEEEYIRDYDAFLLMAGARGPLPGF